jgi:hypothetical protein
MLLPMVGCGTYHYVYHLEVLYELPPERTGEPQVSQPPAIATVQYDGGTKRASFTEFSEVQTIEFTEPRRLEIDGNAYPYGFGVTVHKEGYKDWSADYGGPGLMIRHGDLDGELYRMNSVLLVRKDNPHPSVLVNGAPDYTQIPDWLRDIPNYGHHFFPKKPPSTQIKGGLDSGIPGRR